MIINLEQLSVLQKLRFLSYISSNDAPTQRYYLKLLERAEKLTHFDPLMDCYVVANEHILKYVTMSQEEIVKIVNSMNSLEFSDFIVQQRIDFTRSGTHSKEQEKQRNSKNNKETLLGKEKRKKKSFQHFLKRLKTGKNALEKREIFFRKNENDFSSEERLKIGIFFDSINNYFEMLFSDTSRASKVNITKVTYPEKKPATHEIKFINNQKDSFKTNKSERKYFPELSRVLNEKEFFLLPMVVTNEKISEILEEDLAIIFIKEPYGVYSLLRHEEVINHFMQLEYIRQGLLRHLIEIKNHCRQNEKEPWVAFLGLKAIIDDLDEFKEFVSSVKNVDSPEAHFLIKLGVKKFEECLKALELLEEQIKRRAVLYPDYISIELWVKNEFSQLRKDIYHKFLFECLEKQKKADPRDNEGWRIIIFWASRFVSTNFENTLKYYISNHNWSVVAFAYMLHIWNCDDISKSFVLLRLVNGIRWFPYPGRIFRYHQFWGKCITFDERENNPPDKFLYIFYFYYMFIRFRTERIKSQDVTLAKILRKSVLNLNIELIQIYKVTNKQFNLLVSRIFGAGPQYHEIWNFMLDLCLKDCEGVYFHKL